MFIDDTNNITFFIVYLVNDSLYKSYIPQATLYLVIMSSD